ncbi:acetylxylan esterase [Ruficoccus amylovorans]|uniref:Acetylxylan esterase n=1 Tax=Ruficoccus amylovorans TaxID=1804625 RepID=A0A842HAA5_9BACT|nr:acetylxylan esterase [Ruficoccus amylovorans]MBC2593220.1 acetylxylan esterase [Ruficoccus amylovorans]
MTIVALPMSFPGFRSAFRASCYGIVERTRTRNSLVFCCILMLCTSLFAAEGGLESWEEAWPIDAPLDIEWLAEFQYKTVKVRSLRYTGSVAGGKAQRVYALYAVPQGASAKKKVPAIIQIHGGGQTCTAQNIAWYVERGYACIAFDWGGPRDGRTADVTTAWSSPVRVDYIDPPPGGVGDMFLFHTVLAARRAIDVLQAQPEVDPERIGVQGISWGGLLTWVVGALDGRIKALVPVYGAGGLDAGDKAEGHALLRRGADWARVWTETFDPRRFAPYIKAPVLFCNGTDDWFGTLTASEEVLNALNSPHARSYSANRNHSLGPDNVRAAMAWLDGYLKPDAEAPVASPQVTLSASGDGKLLASIQAPEAVEVSLLVARGGRPDIIKCWMNVSAERQAKDQWSAIVPVWTAQTPVSVIAQAKAASGALISSDVILNCVPSSVEGVTDGQEPAVAGDTIAAAGDAEAWFVETSTDFYAIANGFEPVLAIEVDGRFGVASTDESGRRLSLITTRRLTDPSVRSGEDSRLVIWTHDLGSAEITLNANSYRLSGAERWRAMIRPGAGWVRTVLRPDDFSAANGGNASSMRSFTSIYDISITGGAVRQGTPAVGEIAWEADTRFSE